MSVESRESETDADVAAAVSRELSDAGQARLVTVRSLRDRFGRARLTAPARDQISRALEGAGVGMEPGLERTSLDDEVLLRLVSRRRAPARLGDRLFRGGVRAWKVVVALLGLLATLAGLYAFIEDRLSETPRKQLTGDLNLAVAPFTAVATEGEAAAAGVGEQLARQVKSTVQEHLDQRSRRTEVTFDVAPPPPVDPVEGETDDERTTSAAHSAERVNADVLVYGAVRMGPHRTVVAPSFYISERLLDNAEELVGTHRLGAAMTVAGSVGNSPAARIDLRQLLAARARTLSDFVLGLSHFEQREYAQARRWFREAEQDAEAAGGAAREVIYLFQGHAAGRAGDLGEAERFYAKALSENPNYARAEFGISEVRYQRAHHGCRRGGAEEVGLRAALRGFGRVEMQSQPYGALLRLRARLGRARVLLCLSQAEIDPRWDEAKVLFLEVHRAYQQGEHRLRDEASDALGSLGLIHLPRRGQGQPEQDLREAAAYYERALELSLDASRKAVFSSMLGFIYGKQGRAEAADQAYRRATRLDPDSRQTYARARRALRER